MSNKLNALLELAKSSLKKQEDIPVYANDAYAFIEALNIKKGRNIVKTKDIFDLYSMWSIGPLSSASFFVYFAQKLEPKKSADRYYTLSKSKLQLKKEIKAMLLVRQEQEAIFQEHFGKKDAN